MKVINNYTKEQLIEFSQTVYSRDDKNTFERAQKKANNIYKACINRNTLFYKEGSKTFNFSGKEKFILWLKNLFGFNIIEDIQKIIKKSLSQDVANRTRDSHELSQIRQDKHGEVKKSRRKRKKEDKFLEGENCSKKDHVEVKKEVSRQSETNVVGLGERLARRSDSSKFEQQKIVVEALHRNSRTTDKIKTEHFCIDWARIEKIIQNFKEKALSPGGDKNWLEKDNQDRISELKDAVILTLSDPTGIFKTPKSYRIPKIRIMTGVQIIEKVEQKDLFALLKETRARILRK